MRLSICILVLLVGPGQSGLVWAAVTQQVKARSEYTLDEESFHKEQHAEAVEHATLFQVAPEKGYYETVLLLSTLEQKAEEAKEREATPAVERQKYLAEILDNMVQVHGGCFQMGDIFGNGDEGERPVHEVCVDSFAIAKTEVTQGQYQAVMGSNPSYFAKGDSYPVEQVSWDDAQEFIEKLNALTGRTFRLPTEAEWEYAARSGGRNEKFAGSDEVDSVAWYGRNSGESTHPVAGKQPNALGLYDMSGNVWEWCADWYDVDYYRSSPGRNPAGPSSGEHRVLRGGSWSSYPSCARTAFRLRFSAGYRYYSLGFRLVLQAGATGR